MTAVSAGIGRAVLLWVSTGAVLLGAAGCNAGRRALLDRAREILPASLRSDQSGVRALALEAYRDLAMPVPDVELRTIARRDLDPARFAAVLVKAEQASVGDLRFFDTIFREDDDDSVRLAAIYGLARLGDFRYMQMLADGVMDKRAVVRRNAAMILGLLGNRSAAGMLREHLADADPVARLNVAEALARLGDRSGLPVIRGMVGTGDNEAWWQVNAILALGRVGVPSTDIGRLRDIEGSRGPITVAAKLAAFGARAQLGDYSQAAFLAEAAGGKFGRRVLEPQDRAFALQLLARAAYGPAWHEVAACLDDGDPSVRLSAAWALLAFNSPRADRVKRSIAESKDPHLLTEREVLRPSMQREPPGEPGGALDPSSGRRKSALPPYFP